MKNSRIGIMTLVIATLIASSTAQAAKKSRSGSASRIGVGGEYHREHSAFPELPFLDDDLTYGLSYFNGAGDYVLMLATTYGHNVGGTNGVDYTISPEVNLLFTDRGWRGGTGILSTFIKPEEGDSDWLKLYYQFLLGYSFPVKQFTADIHAIYPFKNIDRLDEFEFSDIQFGAWLSRHF